MANNAILFNAVFSGTFGGINTSRSPIGADYTAQHANAFAFATLVDAAIEAGDYTEQDGELMCSLVQQVVCGKGAAGLNVTTVAAIAAAFELVRTSLVAVPSYGTQTTWAIDPATGDDSNVGTPASPLATMAEFNRRLANTTLEVAATLQLVGDVTDQPLMISGLRVITGASLVVSGTVTAVGTGTITLVTAIQTNVTWQLTTTGIVWTIADIGKRVELSTGAIGWVQEFIDANNVITGPFVTTSIVTPTATTFTVQTLSLATPPVISGINPGFSTFITVQHLQMFGPLTTIGLVTLLVGCKVGASTAAQWAFGVQTTLRGCLIQNSASLTLTGPFGTFTGVTAIGQSILVSGGRLGLAGVSFTNCQLNVLRNGYVTVSAAYHVRNTASPVLVQQSSRILLFNVVMNGSSGNTGVGIDILPGGGFTYLVQKPNIIGNGANPDTVIGTTPQLYAAIPFAEYLATSAPAFMTLES